MSVKALTCAMALRGVSPSEKLLLLALANYADENMRCYPSQRRLAEDTCLSDRTIRSLLAGLEGRQIISRQNRTRTDGSRASDIITLHFAGEVVADISGGAEIISGGVRKPLPGGAETVSGLTTFEPSLEPSIEPEGARKTRRSRRVPIQWLPSPSHFDLAAVEGLTPGEIEREMAKFRDHEFDPPRTDWDACFRTWLRRAAERKPRLAHVRPDPDRPDPKRASREENHARALAGFEIAARGRGER